jgi:hypothetical protein
MSASDQRSVFISRYKSLLDDFTESLGGEAISPARKALAVQLASLQAQLLGLNDKFANGSGSADEVNQFLKFSSAITDLLSTAGLAQAMRDQRIPSAREAEDERAALKAAFGRVIAMRRQDAARTSAESSAVAKAPDEEPAMAAPKPPVLRVVEPASEAPSPIAPAPESGTTVPTSSPAGDLDDRYLALSRKRDATAREISNLAEAALTSSDARARRDGLMADKTAIDAELKEIRAALAKRAADQATTTPILQFGGSERICPSDWSASANPNWPRLR